MAESILYNADIITMDAAQPRARSVLIKDGIIRAVSREDNLKSCRRKNTRLIDCGGKTLLPGFIDPHFHFHAFADSFLSLDLSPRSLVRSIEDIQERIRKLAASTAPGSWIRAKGYNEFYLDQKRHPHRWDLDKAAPGQPVKLTHRSGHAHVLNSLALKRAGIARTTPDPDGGIIERDLDTGEPTGLLYEMGDFLAKRIPAPDAAQFEQAVMKADRRLSCLGITSIQDASARNGLDQWRSFQSWVEKGAIRTRLTMMIGMRAFETTGPAPLVSPVDANRLCCSGVKIILDETTGRLHPPQDLLNETVFQIHRAGRQAAIHAIEETAVASACSAIEYALQKLPGQDHRHRIEHVSVCPPRLARRLAAAGICVVTQPSFLYFNGDRYLKTVPPRQLRHLYPFQSLIREGIAVAASSDSPIVPPDPFTAVCSAATRMCENGAAVGPKERVGLAEALAMVTLKAAWACRQESVKGSICPGKLADMILVDRNPTQIALEEVKELKIEMVFRGGELLEPKI